MQVSGELLEEVVQRLAEPRRETGEDRRKHERYQVDHPLWIRMIDDRGDEFGVELAGRSLNISRSGIRLLTFHAPTSSRVRVVMDVNEVGRIELVTHILRCTEWGPMFDIAGRFEDV